jgi:hypothetical protein
MPCKSLGIHVRDELRECAITISVGHDDCVQLAAFPSLALLARWLSLQALGNGSLALGGHVSAFLSAASNSRSLAATPASPRSMTSAACLADVIVSPPTVREVLSRATTSAMALA